MAGDAVNRGQARQLLLDTAEELFATHGVEGVSLRQVNAGAGVSAGVLHYHFGSREVLVHELINRHMGALMAQRGELLEPLKAQDVPPLREIISALVMPLANLALAEGEPGARYIRFISRLYSDRSAALEEANQRYAEVHSSLRTLLHRSLPDRNPLEVDLKLAMANHAMLQILTDLTSPGRPWLSGALKSVDNEQLTEMLVDFMSDGIVGKGGKSNG